MIRFGPALLLAMTLALGTGRAIAQAHDSNAPLDWTADRIEVQDKAHKAVLVGNVRVVQQEMTLTAARVTANYLGSLANAGQSGPPGAAAAPKSSSPQIQRMDATGNVVVTRPQQIAKGDYGIYDLDRKLITLIGHVSLDRNGSIVHGGRLVINQTTGQATVDGSSVGGTGNAGQGGRVSGRFLVANGNDNGTAKPAPAPTTKPH